MHNAIIILAAGSSSRMGQSKQLLKIGNETLLARAVRIATESNAHSITVVLGANAKIIQESMEFSSIDWVTNKDWKRGMGSSLKTGLYHTLAQHPETESILVMVCDQPRLTANHLISLISKSYHTDKSIIASYYNLTPGVPVLFGRKHFEEISLLRDDEGAKKVVLKNPAVTEIIDFPEGAVDIDTPEDFEHALKTVQ